MLPASESITSPVLQPYPSWQAHKKLNPTDVPDIVSPFHIKVDRCDRLWIVDTGIDGLTKDNQLNAVAPARVRIYNLKDDNVFRTFNLPSGLKTSIFSNIVVDDNDCEDAFAYIADAGTPPSLNVYSLKSNRTWMVQHNSFNIDPLAGNFTLLGVQFQTQDALYGLTLTEKKENGYPELYFHALAAYNEYKVSTMTLRNETLWTYPGFSAPEIKSEVYKLFTHIGARKTNEQAGASVYDKTQNVFFYTLPNENAVGCWKLNNQNYTISNVFSSVTDMVYPIDIKIINNNTLWILSNKMQKFLYNKLDIADTNFYIHTVSVKDAVKNTECEPGFIEKIKKTLSGNGKGKGAGPTKPIAFLTIIASIMLLIKHIF